MSQLVIGLGEIGQPIFDLLLLQELVEVWGRDLEEPEDFPKDFDVLHICFPYSDEFVEQVVQYVGEYGVRDGVIIHSTVVPGTIREIEKETAHLWPIVYSPVRGRHGQMTHDLLRYKKFYASRTKEGASLARKYLAPTGMELVRFPQPVEGLELAKLLETTYSALLISWAQEMDRYSDLVDAYYLDVATFWHDLSNFPPVVHLPGFIGGHCLMPNLDLLERVADSDFVRAVRNSNERVLKRNVFEDNERFVPIDAQQNFEDRLGGDQ